MTAGDCRCLVQGWLADGSFATKLPEVAALAGVPQPEEYHAEGDAAVHTLLAMETVAEDADPRVFWGVLLHDIGKATTTRHEGGRWRSPGHAQAGAAQVPGIMARLGFPELGADVAWLVRHHDFHLSWQLTPGDRLSRNQQRFLDQPLFPLLLEVCTVDAAAAQGRSRKGELIAYLAELLERASSVPAEEADR